MSECTATLRHDPAALIAAVRSGSRGGEARCPAHSDRDPSLSVSPGRDGRVLVKCHRDCTTESVVAALGMTMGDLAAAGAGDDWTPAGPAVATYEYVDEDGATLFGVARTADKAFRQWRPDPAKKSGRTWSLNGTRRVPYRLPKVIAAARAGATVHVVEGEKDVHAIERAGGTATCNPGGAGKWRPEYADYLAGAHVVVVADRDDPGRAHAADVAASLQGVAASIRVVEAAEGKDAADHLGAGLGLDQLVPVEVSTDVDTTGYETSTVADLAARPPAPTIVGGLIPGGGRLVEVTASRGAGKSWLALSLALAMHCRHTTWVGHPLTPGPVVYVPLEGADTVADRATTWAAAHGEDVGGFPVVTAPRLGLLADDGDRLVATARQAGAVLIVLDAWRQVLEGASDEDKELVPRTLEVVERVQRDTGATVLILHNTGWQERGRARGLAVFEDAAYSVLTLAGDAAGVAVDHTKNRTGPAVPRWWFTLAPDGVPRRSGVPGGTVDERMLRLEMAVLDALPEPPDGLTRTELLGAVGGRKETLRHLLDAMVRDGRLHEERAMRGSVTVSKLSRCASTGSTGSHRVPDPVALTGSAGPTPRGDPVPVVVPDHAQQKMTGPGEGPGGDDDHDRAVETLIAAFGATAVDDPDPRYASLDELARRRRGL